MNNDILRLILMKLFLTEPSVRFGHCRRGYHREELRHFWKC